MVYFASADEQRQIERGLLPQARRHPVADDLRGWSWHRPPLSPIYAHALGVHEVGSKYCPTGRDVFLRRVEHVRGATTDEMRRGKLYHKLLAGLITRAKQFIYVHGVECVPLLDGLKLTRESESLVAADVDAMTRQNLAALQAFEAERIAQRVADVLARQPHIGADGLVALALPVSVELSLDGRHLGLSPHLSVDAVSFPNLAVSDVKFGQREDFHRLSTTGYALVLESLFETRVDLGCVVYVRFDKGRIVVDRDFHVIDDELRQVFIEERDEKMRMVSEAIDPGLPPRCPSRCPYLRTCYPIRTTAGSDRAISANPTSDIRDGIGSPA